MIGDVSPEMRKLVQVTKECMEIGIAAAQPWKQLGDVGAAIQEHAEKNGFNVVRDLCGHGVGTVSYTHLNTVFVQRSSIHPETFQFRKVQLIQAYVCKDVIKFSVSIPQGPINTIRSEWIC